MKNSLTILALLGILSGCSSNMLKFKNMGIETTESKMTNKEIVGTFLGSVLKHDPETMRKLANSNYIQHST